MPVVCKFHVTHCNQYACKVDCQSANTFKLLLLSEVERSRATMVGTMDVGKRMRLTEPEQYHAMVKMHLRY